MMNDLTKRAREVFAADCYASKLTGITIEDVGENSAVCALRGGDNHRNARGVAMGGVLFTLADFCAAVAANSRQLAVDKGQLQWVSLDSTIHFLAPATGESLIAHAAALKVGRSTALYQTTIECPDDGRRIAVVETTMISVSH